MRWYAEEADNPLEHRAELLAKHGVLTYDLLLTRWRCRSCAADTDGPPPMAIPLVPYRSLESAEASLRRSLQAALSGEDSAPECDTCGRPAELVRVDHHFFHSLLERDIVLRSSGGAIERLEWSADSGYAPLRELTGDQRRVIARDALLRAAKAFVDHDEHERLAETLFEALSQIPGEPFLVKFLPRLNRVGAHALVLLLAEAQARLNPDEPAGHYWSAQIPLQAALAGNLTLLPEIEQRFSRAVALCADYPDAEIGLANVARLKKDLPEAERRLRELLRRHPSHAVGHYTLGLVLLPARPAGALIHFAAGEADSPTDADYPRGRARALLLLGRPREALEAAQRAKLLAHRDSRIDSIIAECLTTIERTTS